MLYKSLNQDKVKEGVPWAPGKNSEVSHERNANAGGEQIQTKTATHLTWKPQIKNKLIAKQNRQTRKIGAPKI